MAERMQGRMARAEHLEEEARAESGGHAHEGRTGHVPDMIPMSEAESLRMDGCVRQWQEQALERMNPDRLPGDLRSYLSAPVKSEPTGHAVAMGPPTGHAVAMSLPTFETGKGKERPQALVPGPVYGKPFQGKAGKPPEYYPGKSGKWVPPFRPMYTAPPGGKTGKMCLPEGCYGVRLAPEGQYFLFNNKNGDVFIPHCGASIAAATGSKGTSSSSSSDPNPYAEPSAPMLGSVQGYNPQCWDDRNPWCPAKREPDSGDERSP